MNKTKSHPNIEVVRVSVELENLDTCVPATLITRGNSFYLRLDREIVRFWELKPGDKILTRLVQVKRTTSEKMSS